MIELDEINLSPDLSGGSARQIRHCKKAAKICIERSHKCELWRRQLRAVGRRTKRPITMPGDYEENGA